MAEAVELFSRAHTANIAFTEYPNASIESIQN